MKVKVDIIRASYVSIIIGYILTLTTIPQGDVIGSAFTSIGLILALYKILFLNHYKIKQYFLLTIVGILFFVSAYRTRNYQFAITFIFILSATRMSIDKLIAIDLKVRVPLIFLVCALGYSGVILNRLDYDIRGLGLDRQALGFTHQIILAQ